MQGKYHRWLIALCLSVGTHTQSSSTGEIRAEDSNDQEKVYDLCAGGRLAAQRS